MKIIFDMRGNPFFLAHGGVQVQVEQTKAALESIGIEVEYARWWDSKQKTDIIHCFSRAAITHIRFAHRKGIKYVMAELLTGQGSRSLPQLYFEGLRNRVLKGLGPKLFSESTGWSAYLEADGCIALTSWEARIMTILFSAPSSKIHVVPNGVEDIFILPEKERVLRSPRRDYLVCTATICERKRVLELAQAAFQARVPIHIIGKPYGLNDPYYLKFAAFAKKASEYVRFDGPVSNRNHMAEIYKSARGFVLLSNMESLSLSALESTASGCPLLLSDLPWARCTFGDSATYCPVNANINMTALALKNFYESAPTLKIPPTPLTWRDIAYQFRDVYTRILSE